MCRIPGCVLVAGAIYFLVRARMITPFGEEPIVPKSPNKNAFLDKLKYPTHGKHAKYPYPAHDTGIEVTAMTLNGNPWDEDGKSDDPFEVLGNLLIRPSPFGGFQCFVSAGDDTWCVDSETVRPTPNLRKANEKLAPPTAKKTSLMKKPKAAVAKRKPKAVAGKASRNEESTAGAKVPPKRKAGKANTPGPKKRK